MAIYEYLHPKTKEIFEEMRSIKDRDKPFIATDGVECKRIISRFGGWRKGREPFEVDSDYCKKLNPKFIKFNDGHRERYDPRKHN